MVRELLFYVKNDDKYHKNGFAVVSTPSKMYPTLSGIIRPSLKSIGQL